MDVEKLASRFSVLFREASQASLKNTRIDHLAAAEKAKEAASVADLIGGAEGAVCRAEADHRLASCLICLGNIAAAERAACSALRAARAAGDRSSLVRRLAMCGSLANYMPGEMFTAEIESREQERLSGSPSYGGLDLSQEGRISLPTTPEAFSRLGLAYNEAAVASCDAALAAVGSRDSPAADDEQLVPSLALEAEARGCLGISLHEVGERQRGLELLRRSVLLLRQDLRTVADGGAARATNVLAGWLCHLGSFLSKDSARTAEAAACLREALELSEVSDDV